MRIARLVLAAQVLVMILAPVATATHSVSAMTHNRTKIALGVGVVGSTLLGVFLITNPGFAVDPPAADEVSRIAELVSEPGECVTVSNPLIAQPLSIPASIKSQGGWVVVGESYVGAAEDAAKALGGRLVDEPAADSAWVFRDGGGGVEAIRLSLIAAQDGTPVWVTTTTIRLIDCPAD